MPTTADVEVIKRYPTCVVYFHSNIAKRWLMQNISISHWDAHSYRLPINEEFIDDFIKELEKDKLVVDVT